MLEELGSLWIRTEGEIQRSLNRRRVREREREREHKIGWSRHIPGRWHS